MNLEIERLQMNVSHQHSSSQSSAPIKGVEPDREHNQRLFYLMGRHIYSLNKSNGYSQSVMETKENIVSFHHIDALKFLIKDTSTIRVNSTEQNNTAIESNLLACNLQLLANADCMLNSLQKLGPTAVDYSKQGAEVYLTVNSSSVYKTNLGGLPPKKKFALNDTISAITFDKEFTKLYVFTYSGQTNTVRYFNLLNDELSEPIILKDIPDEITHAVFAGEQAILCQIRRADMSSLLLLDSRSGKHSYVSEEKATLPCNHSECSRVLAIKALAHHQNKDQSIYAVDNDSELISLSYNGNQNSRQDSITM